MDSSDSRFNLLCLLSILILILMVTYSLSAYSTYKSSELLRSGISANSVNCVMSWGMEGKESCRASKEENIARLASNIKL